jgi:RNA polymerase sigma-70 factor (ECF subfamily)
MEVSNKQVEESDDVLAARARDDPEVFVPLYRRYFLPIYRYLYTRCETVKDAEDLTSQVFLAALEGLPRYRPHGHFAAWLFAIARRKAADHHRSHAPMKSIDVGAEIPALSGDPLSILAADEELRLLAGLVACLDEDERELIRLRFAARLSFTDMAVLLGRKESAVKMSLYRLLGRLKRALEVENG